MKLENTFAVTAPIDQVWETLMGFERVAGCVPGASVRALTEDAFDVTMRVKLGPILMQYKGTLEVVERDPGAHRAVVRGRAQETKGQGTAAGLIELRLARVGDVTRGTSSADIRLSGRAAAMGKAVISKVAEQLMVQFGQNLQALLTSSAEVTADAGRGPAVPRLSGTTVVEGVEGLAAGSRSETMPRDPDKATPVEQVEGDIAMTQGRSQSAGPDEAGGRRGEKDAQRSAQGDRDPAVPERSGDTVAEGVETLAAGTQHEGVLRDLEESTPHTAPVEQIEGDRAMTEGRSGTGSGAGAQTKVPETRMPEAPVSGGAQSSPAARVSDRLSASGEPRPAPGGSAKSAAAPESLDALALVRSMIGAQLSQPRVRLGLLLPAVGLAGAWLGRRSVRR